MAKEEKDRLKNPYELFGVECGKGWKDLIMPLFDYIEKYNEGKPEEEKIKVEQVKEKFGGLRFYVNVAPKELFDMIDKAERDSYNVCETCGTRENVGLTVDGWYETICRDCLKKKIKDEEKYYGKGYKRVWKRLDNEKVYYVYADKEDKEKK